MHTDEQKNTRGNKHRYTRVVGQFDGSTKPKRKPLRGISQEERRNRWRLIENGVSWGMSVEQISRYTETQGEKISERKIYDYLADIRVPKRYRPDGSNQHHHEFMVFETFLKLAHDLKAIGKQATVVSFGKSPGDGAGFRYDCKFRVGKYLFYVETQLSDIAQTSWRTKHRKYVSWYEKNDFPFRVLFIVDQHRDMSVIRAHGRSVLSHRPALALFYYCTLNELRSPVNIALEAVWRTAEGERCTLIPLAGEQVSPREMPTN